MVGLLAPVDRRVPSQFAAEGDDVLILGATRGELGGSAYWSEIRNFVGGAVPPVDLVAERRLQDLLVSAAERRLLRSAHDASEGGLVVALAEAAIGNAYAPAGVGAQLDLTGYAAGASPEGLLYGEDAGRVVISADPGHRAALVQLARTHSVPLFHAGRVGGRELELRLEAGVFRWDVATLRRIYFEAIPRRMQQADAERSIGE
jgi:phosphoribosylformylglycinamidine synthase